jgi:hypothetical protein
MSEAGEIAAFCAARLDEDEAAAKAGGGGEWHDDHPAIGVVLVGGEPLIEGHVTGLTPHIARHDPARVLRDVAAGRAILGLFVNGFGTKVGVVMSAGTRIISGDWLLRCLASARSDHPDYRKEWAP